ncbi:MAG: carbamoyltransferase [Chloroflexi bacterium]|nr:carbamoyltransferase [Chloroflexota bacterium]
MTFILGINAAFHDSSACIVSDGVMIAAAEEERFTGVKHAKRPTPFTAFQLPFHAIDFCLRQTRIGLADVDDVAYSFDPRVLMEPGFNEASLPFFTSNTADADRSFRPDWHNLFVATIAAAPRMLIDDVPFHLRARWNGVKVPGRFRFHFVEHHLAHAASAYFPSPFEEAAVLTIDGQGEKATTLYAKGEGCDLQRLREVFIPNSLGIFYEDLTTHLGFLNSSDEYKVMALASYGKPRWIEEMRQLVQYEGDGDLRVLPADFSQLFGPRRTPGSPLEQWHFDLAASGQRRLEEVALAMSDWLYEKTRSGNLCLAGGVALNCVMNSAIRKESPFRNIFVQPAANDAGTAIGAALWVWNSLLGQDRLYTMRDAYLGPAFSDDEIEAVLRRGGLTFSRPADICRSTAEILAKGQIVGWFQGRMEFGPRALGARSILADPSDPSMLSRVNELKDREDFRPVAPAVLAEKSADFFDGLPDSPFMLFTFDTKDEAREKIPSAIHVDGSARVQTVSSETSPLFHRLIEEFAKLTGLPILINTSFNIRGKPIVCRPEDALECFFLSPIDALAIGSFLLEK